MTTVLGKMKGSYRNPTTVSGESFSVMKSALQKYIRRGNIEMACRVAYEIDCYNYDSEKNAKGHVTNFIHRLMIIFVEDIGPCAIALIGPIYACFKKLMEIRAKRLALTEFSEQYCKYRRQEVEILTIAIILMCKSNKGRSGSHYKSVYFPNQDKRLVAIHPILQQIQDRAKEPVPTGIDLPLGESKFILDLCKHFYANLDRHDPMCVYWAFRIIDSVPAGSYFRKKKSSYLIFFMMHVFISTQPEETQDFYGEILRCCIDLFSEISPLKEEFLFWLVPLISMVEKRNPEPFEYPTAEEVHDLMSTYYRKALDGEKIKLDEYVFDMHVKDGKGGRIYFANESSKVFPEDPLVNNLYRTIYNQYKYLQDGKTIEDYLKDHPAL